MEILRFIITLHRGFAAYQREIEVSKREYYNQYYNFLRNLGFYGLVERVMQAVVMYPRSMDMCKDNLDDLAYSIVNDFGLGVTRFSTPEYESVANLVKEVGREVLGFLDGHRYFLNPNRFPRGLEDDDDYLSDLTAVADVRRVSAFTFKVTVTEQYLSDILSDVEENNTLPVQQSFTRSLH